MSSSSAECRTSDSSSCVSRETARARVVATLTRAERIADAMTPGSADFDATRVRAYIDLASEWRYLADEL